MREAGGEILSTEGEDGGEWVLVDLGDIVVANVMQPTIRSYYNLEELWGGKGPERVYAIRRCGCLKPQCGSASSRWVTSCPTGIGACAEYIKRMPRELPLSVVEVKPEPRGLKTREQLLAASRSRACRRPCPDSVGLSCSTSAAPISRR